MDELAKALISTSAFAAPKCILQDIAAPEAYLKPATALGSAPHCIYDEVWHMAFWQSISLDWVEGKPTAVPDQAATGFPADITEAWDELRNRFLAGAQNAAAVANDRERLDVEVSCPTIGDADRTMTVRDQMISLAAHNSYHLGRIVLLRQLLGNWPPPDGGYTW